VLERQAVVDGGRIGDRAAGARAEGWRRLISHPHHRAWGPDSNPIPTARVAARHGGIDWLLAGGAARSEALLQAVELALEEVLREREQRHAGGARHERRLLHAVGQRGGPRDHTAAAL